MRGLKTATNNLYTTFSYYRFKATNGCECCVSADDKRKLHSNQLRELEATDIERYAFKAMTTWGDTYDFKHFLPRIFELASQRKIYPSITTILGKLDIAKWQYWSLKEQKSIQDFLTEWWGNDINNNSYFDSETLIAINEKVNDITSLLAKWHLNIEKQGFRNFVEFISSDYKSICTGKGWIKKLPNTDRDIFLRWVDSNIKKLEKGFFVHENTDDEFATDISIALQIYEAVKF